MVKRGWVYSILLFALGSLCNGAWAQNKAPTSQLHLRQTEDFFITSPSKYPHGLGISQSGTTIGWGDYEPEPVDRFNVPKRFGIEDLGGSEAGAELRVRFSFLPALLNHETESQVHDKLRDHPYGEQIFAAAKDRIHYAETETLLPEAMFRHVSEGDFGTDYRSLGTVEAGKAPVHFGLPTRDGKTGFAHLRVFADSVEAIDDAGPTGQVGMRFAWFLEDEHGSRQPLRVEVRCLAYHRRVPIRDHAEFLNKELLMSADDWSQEKRWYALDSQGAEVSVSRCGKFDVSLSAVNERGQWGEKFVAQYEVNSTIVDRLVGHAAHHDQSGDDLSGVSIFAEKDLGAWMAATNIVTAYVGYEQISNTFEPLNSQTGRVSHQDWVTGFQCRFGNVLKNQNPGGWHLDIEVGPEVGFQNFDGELGDHVRAGFQVYCVAR